MRAATDLALLDVGVSAHGVLAVIENLSDVPSEMASGVARAVGRLWEHHDEPFLEAVLEVRVLPHDGAAGDALVELGLGTLRGAFVAPGRVDASDALARSVELFERARKQDEDRPDARAFSAAARAVLAFDSDADAMSGALEELAGARGELERYGAEVDAGFRGATPLRSVAAWHVLAASLRGLREHLDKPNVLNLRPAIEALSDAYAGVRLGVLRDERRGLIGYIQPAIRESVVADVTLKKGLAEFAKEQDAPASAGELAGEVVSPKAACSATRRWRLRNRRQP